MRLAFLPALLALFSGCSAIPLVGKEEPLALRSETFKRPSDYDRSVEILWVEPAEPPPWPVVVYVHGHQERREGAKAFADWGVLRKTAQQGFLAAAVSLPGYGRSEGPRDFAGPDTQTALVEAVERLRARPDVVRGKTVLYGVSRGATVAARVAEGVAGLAGVVLISGVYEMGDAYSLWKRSPAGSEGAGLKAAFDREVVVAETGPTELEVAERSVLPHPDIRSPLLTLHGAEDPIAPAGQARELVERTRERGFYAKAVIYPGKGHYVPVEEREKEVALFLKRAFGLHVLPLED